MTDATRGLVRYTHVAEFDPFSGDVSMESIEDETFGDWVRYEDAARIQRARARNLVARLRSRANLVWAVSGPGYREGIKHDTLHAISDRIAAKYLGEGT